MSMFPSSMSAASLSESPLTRLLSRFMRRHCPEYISMKVVQPDNVLPPFGRIIVSTGNSFTKSHRQPRCFSSHSRYFSYPSSFTSLYAKAHPNGTLTTRGAILKHGGTFLHRHGSGLIPIALPHRVHLKQPMYSPS
jgi:hypothetical protein